MQLALQQQAPPVATVPVTLQVTASQPAAPPAPQPVNVQISAATPAPMPVATTTVPTTVSAEVHHAGPLGRFIAKVGDKMTRAGYTRVLIPPTPATAVVQPVSYQVVQPTTSAVTYQAAPVQVQQVQAVTASPQASSPIRRLFGH